MVERVRIHRGREARGRSGCVYRQLSQGLMDVQATAASSTELKKRRDTGPQVPGVNLIVHTKRYPRVQSTPEAFPPQTVSYHGYRIASLAPTLSVVVWSSCIVHSAFSGATVINFTVPRPLFRRNGAGRQPQSPLTSRPNVSTKHWSSTTS